MPKKNFVAGTVLRAADVNTYLTDSKNVIINGAFDIWQRGTSMTTGGSDTWTYGADRWNAYNYATNAVSLTQQTFTPGTAPVAGYEGQYFMRCTSTNNKLYLRQTVENVRTFAGQTVTLSFWAKSASAQTVSAFLGQNTGTGGTGSVETATQTVSVTTSWARYSLTFSLAALTGKTLGANSFLYMVLTGAINNAFDIWGVQLEEGSSATEFSRNANSIQAELAACQRYYYRITSDNLYGVFGLGRCANTTVANIIIPTKQTLRTKPTAVEWTTTGSHYSVGTGTITNLIIEQAESTVQNISVQAQGSGFTTGFAVFGAVNNSVAYIGFSAEF